MFFCHSSQIAKFKKHFYLFNQIIRKMAYNYKKRKTGLRKKYKHHDNNGPIATDVDNLNLIILGTLDPALGFLTVG